MQWEILKFKYWPWLKQNKTKQQTSRKKILKNPVLLSILSKIFNFQQKLLYMKTHRKGWPYVDTNESKETAMNYSIWYNRLQSYCHKYVHKLNYVNYDPTYRETQ